jgi:hypothetical protein
MKKFLLPEMEEIVNMNTKFIYLYRDSGNYKNMSIVIFLNPENISLAEAQQRLEVAFEQKLLFIASQIGLPDLFHDDFPTSDDISFHEFSGLEFTEQDINDKRTLKKFFAQVEKESKIGWKVFDPQERLFTQI